MTAYEASGQREIWDEFNSDEYIGHNYRDGVLPEDQEMIRGMMAGIETLDVPPYQADVVADIGNAGVFHYSGILQHLVAPGGRIEYTEYSPHGLHVARRTLETYAQTGDMGYWEKFGDTVLQVDPGYAVGPRGEVVHPTARSLGLGVARHGNIYDLKPGAYDAAGTFYCPDSISTKQEDWNAATESFVKSVKPGGLVVVTAMQQSEGYTTPDPKGEIVFPAFPVSTEIVAGRLEELGVRDVQIAEAFDAEHGARPADGPQYQGVCLAMGIRAVEVAKPTIII